VEINLTNKLFFSLYLFITIFCLAACDNKKTISLPGYIEGRYTYISPTSGGILKNIYVNAGDEVKINQPLFVLDEYLETQDVEAATARVTEATDLKKKAEANYILQKEEYERKSRLFKQGIIAKDRLAIENTEYQQAALELKAAEQNISALLATKQKAEWTSQQKIVKSPIDSFVFDTYYNVGELVPNATPVLSLLAPGQIKIIFFVSEKTLSQLKINEPIDIVLDGYKHSIKARITYISDQAQYTPPIIYSSDQRQKLVYRIEASPRAKSKDLLQLHPGQPITVNLTQNNKQD
jgi:HlyD family secretion protein